MEDKKPINTWMEKERETEEQLNQFLFIIFVPNPVTKTIKMWIDGNENVTYLNKEKFINIIEMVCGRKEANRLEIACCEYGIPYMYDREKQRLQQLYELPPERNIEITPDYHKEFEKNGNTELSSDNLFNSVIGNLDTYKSIGFPKK